ncbi:hypothetical protein [Bacillus andreraoultii]|uniref:hypothetical protein n=1 Tax=Bacillus andreraoultii TaxID=1499685 RepID=UPI00053BA3D6|nr:hypothetical protein [Bacillus andreraoultii]
MFCECGGILLVVAVEELPTDLASKKKQDYNRVCDVQCQKCGKVYYSQPYDYGKAFNIVKKTKSIDR